MLTEMMKSMQSPSQIFSDTYLKSRHIYWFIRCVIKLDGFNKRICVPFVKKLAQNFSFLSLAIINVG